MIGLRLVAKLIIWPVAMLSAVLLFISLNCLQGLTPRATGEQMEKRP